MNRRQAKKELKKEYGIITPRQASPRLTKKFTLSLIDYEAIKKLADELGELFRRLGEVIGKFINDNINEIIERLKEAIDKSLQYGDKPKYKPVKSLIKPYKQPFIKVRYRARANLKRG